jgi:hypothetical protein
MDRNNKKKMKNLLYYGFIRGQVIKGQVSILFPPGI